MNLLFCHDGPLQKDKNGNYYGVAFNNDAFARYYYLADNLKIAIRVNHLSVNQKTNNLSQITHKSLDIIECPNLASIKSFLSNHRKAKKILSQQIDCASIIVIRLPSLIGFKAAKIVRKKRKPYIIETVACPFDAYWNRSLFGKILAPIVYFIMRKEVKKAKHVIYVTNRFLQNRYPTNGESINCSNVVIKNIDEKVLKNRIEKINLQKKEDQIILGTVGAIDIPHKGQANVIKMLAKCEKKGISNLQYQLVGGGNQTQLKKLAKRYGVLDKIQFLGTLNANDVFAWLDTIDIYIQPSLQEGLPRAVIEAMSRALPIIGANTGGIPELINQEFIFSKYFNRISNMCKIINKLQNKNILMEQAKRNYSEALKFHIDILNKKRESFYFQIKREYNLIRND
jgi:glycosyltransferase involved in cell wall biosynthesis